MKLTARTETLAAHFFQGEELDFVKLVLQEECGNNLTGTESCNPEELERLRFAVLKIADGKPEKLNAAITLANSDWRDLLMIADFANDIHIHERWADTIIAT
jgi:hypothetical protein